MSCLCPVKKSYAAIRILCLMKFGLGEIVEIIFNYLSEIIWYSWLKYILSIKGKTWVKRIWIN